MKPVFPPSHTYPHLADAAASSACANRGQVSMGAAVGATAPTLFWESPLTPLKLLRSAPTNFQNLL